MITTMSTKNIYVIVLICFCVHLSYNKSLSPTDQQRYKDLLEGKGLYNITDNVEIFTSNNIQSKLYAQKRAWIVEFYNAWCGYCQRFAPSWKALATDWKSWNTLMGVGAMDCSNDDNMATCRDLDIISYPTLRYFHEFYEDAPGNIGVTVQAGEDLQMHKIILSQQLINEQMQGRAAQFPNLLPYQSSNLNNLFDDQPETTKYVFLIVEGSKTLMGPEIAIQLRSIVNVGIRYALHNNTRLIEKYSITSFPTILAVARDQAFDKIAQGINARDVRDGVIAAIREFLVTKNIAIPEFHQHETNIFDGKWIDAPVPDMSALMEARQQQELKAKLKKMGDVVFQMDLEMALRHSLKDELGLFKTITGERLRALQAYLSVVAKYFPFGPYGLIFLAELRDKTMHQTSVSGEEISNAVKAAEQNKLVFSSPAEWLACKGTSDRFRGYPCGMWTMFHYFTVNAAEQQTDNSNPREVLDAMHGYIKNFFGCSDCSRHFQEMAAEDDMNKVPSAEASILWLWTAHNKVNKRLAGDPTEDPEFPKIQFPSTDRCPLCKNSGSSWNYQEILKYLKYVYSNVNVRYIGSDSRILHGNFARSGNNNETSGIFENIDAKGIQKKDVRSRPVRESMSRGWM